MVPPLPGETKTYITAIGFINDDIIQIYAVADNIPYTSDDIIVFEPFFWEKIFVDVAENKLYNWTPVNLDRKFILLDQRIFFKT